MSTQEQFAAWHKERFGWDYAELGGDDYNLLACWLAAEAVAIERCAKVCIERIGSEKYEFERGWNAGSADCAEEILALLKSDGSAT